MLGMKENIDFIMHQPENEFIKFFATNPKEINDRMNEIRSRVVAINQDSMTEATAYWALGEKQAALNTIENYRNVFRRFRTYKKRSVKSFRCG